MALLFFMIPQRLPKRFLNHFCKFSQYPGIQFCSLGKYSHNPLLCWFAVFSLENILPWANRSKSRLEAFHVLCYFWRPHHQFTLHNLPVYIPNDQGKAEPLCLQCQMLQHNPMPSRQNIPLFYTVSALRWWNKAFNYNRSQAHLLTIWTSLLSLYT